ncbi:MAG: GntR family transcriptional regulator [Oscillospiraceae bacterium]
MPATTSVSLEIYETLKAKIINFELMPGQLLMVQQLSKELEISRTPVREAMVRLKEDGFVQEASGRKFRVTEVTWEFISNLYKVRIILETTAVRESANTITKLQIKALRQLVNRMEKSLKSGDYDGLIETDMDFHNYILSLLNNSIIFDWMGRMKDHQQRIRYLTSGIEGRLAESIVEHSRFVDSIEHGDFAKAEAMLREHLETTVNDIQKYRSGGNHIASSIIK